MRPFASLVAGVALLAAGPAAAQSQMCSRLRDFVRDQMAETAEPAPRHWVEFHWGFDTSAIASKGCRHSDDQSSADLCNWLVENSSWEFRSQLPLRILDCFGFRSPRHAAYDWSVSEGSFRHRYADGTWLRMEVTDSGLPEFESALRLSVETIERQLDPDELAPIQPLTVAEVNASE